MNHGDEPATVDVRGHELLHDCDVDGRLTVPAGDVAVVREAR